MTISVDVSTFVVTIPKADLALVQLTPKEIYELDLNALHHWLREWSADPLGGIDQPTTHKHDTVSSLSGIDFARKLEFLEPFSYTFEDGQYAVRFLGANTNLDEKVNVNQVSVRPNNSAGLISSPDIEFAAYKDGIVYNASSPYAGTMHPTGSFRQPVNNLMDAGLIAKYRGVNKGLVFGGSLTIDGTTPVSKFHFIGEGPSRTTITILPEAEAEDVVVEECHLLGTLDGNSRILRCLLTDLNYINGYIDSCVLAQGTIVLGGNKVAHILNSVAGEGLSTVDMGDTGQGMVLQNYCGPLKIINKTGPEAITLGLKSGNISIDLDTVTNGTIVASGTGSLIDSNTGDIIPTGSYGDLVVINLLVGVEAVVNGVWKYVRP